MVAKNIGLLVPFPAPVTESNQSPQLVKHRRKRPISGPKYLSLQQIEALFSVIDSVRDKAIFRLIYHRGLRASEPGLLQLADFRDRAGRLFVHRKKGSISAEHPLCDAELRALRAWLKRRGTKIGPIFESRNHRPISAEMILVLFRGYCRKAGIPPELAHPHSLKHSCGTHLFELGEHLEDVQDHLGHANIQNTLIYAKLGNKRRDERAERLRSW